MFLRAQGEREARWFYSVEMLQLVAASWPVQKPSCLQPWSRLPREAVESPSLEIFQPHLDKVLCSLLWVTLLGQGVGLGDPQRSLPTSNILGFRPLLGEAPKQSRLGVQQAKQLRLAVVERVPRWEVTPWSSSDLSDRGPSRAGGCGGRYLRSVRWG